MAGLADRNARSIGMSSPGAWGPFGLASLTPEQRRFLKLAGGNIALGFTPGAGLADATGVMPDVEGNFQPSYLENMREGNYGQAALQGVGAAAEGLSALGPVGMAAAGVIRAPKGLANAIKAFGATGRTAKQIESGIAKLRAGETPTAPQMAAVEEASRSGLRQARNALEKADIRPKGAPPHIANKADHDAMVQSLAIDAETGKANQTWYPESTDKLRETYAESVPKQDRLLISQGMSSQQTGVGRDTGIAYRGMINAEHFPDSNPPGIAYRSPQGQTEMQPWSPGHIYGAVNDKVMGAARGRDVEPVGGKIGPFTTNLITGGSDPTAAQIAQYPWMAKHLDDKGRNLAVTDMIMHQRFGYPDSAKATGTRGYVTSALREATDASRPISEAQAQVWLPTQHRLGAEGRYSYKDAVDEMTGLMNVETTLGSNTGIEKVFRTAEMPYEQRRAFDTHMLQALAPNGRSEILSMLGMPQQNARGGMGAYEGQFNPVTTFQPVMPAAGPGSTGVDADGWRLVPREIKAEGLGWDGPGSVTMHEMVIPNVNFANPLDDTTARAVTLGALLHQKLGFQKGQGWIRPYVPEQGHPTEASDWFQIDLGRQLTQDEAKAFDALGMPPIVRGNAIGWLNLGGKPNVFQSKLFAAADRVIGDGLYDLVHAPTQRWYFENDWKDGYDATQIDKAIASLGPQWEQRGHDVQRALAPRVGAALEDWARGNDITVPDDLKRVFEAWGAGRVAGREAGLGRQRPSQAVGLAGSQEPRSLGLAGRDPFALED